MSCSFALKKITDLAEQTRLLYPLTFHIDCRQKMRRLNKELRLVDGFNQIVDPFLLEAFSKIVVFIVDVSLLLWLLLWRLFLCCGYCISFC